LQRESAKEFEKQFGISPQFKTSGFTDITSDMNRGTADMISDIRNNISAVQDNLDSIAVQKTRLMEEWTAYENVAADIADMNEIVQQHELAKWIEKETAEGGLFEKRDDLPGARAAFRKEYTSPSQRTKDINIITRQKKAEAKTLADTVYQTISKTLTDESNLGKDPDKWKEAFPKTHMIASSAFGNENMEDFIYTYHNAPPEFRQELAQISGISDQVGHLIAHSNTIRQLEAEAAGWDMNISNEQEAFDHNVALNSLKALDVTNASKEDLFRWHRTNVPVHATDDQHRMLFGEVEEILRNRGETGDLGTEYINWINTGKIVDESGHSIYEDQKDRFGKTGIDFGDKHFFGDDYKWDPKLRVIYTDRGVDNPDRGWKKTRMYYVQKPGFKERYWVDESEAIEMFDWIPRRDKNGETIPSDIPPAWLEPAEDVDWERLLQEYLTSQQADLR